MEEAREEEELDRLAFECLTHRSANGATTAARRK